MEITFPDFGVEPPAKQPSGSESLRIEPEA